MSECVPRRLLASSFVVGTAGLAAVYLAWRDYPVSVWLPVAILVLSAVLSEWTQVLLPGGDLTSLGFPLSIAAAVLAGPFAAGLVALCSATGFSDVKSRRAVHKVYFNMGQLSLSAVISAYAYLYLGGRILCAPDGTVLPLSSADFPKTLVSLLALGIVAFSVNAALLSYAISSERGVTFASVWTSSLAWAFPMQIALTFLGASIAQVISIQPLSVLLFFFPLVVSRQVYLRYVNLKEAYLDTVRSLVGTLEAKDEYTRGHSDRVASFAEQVARSMEMSDEEIERIRIAAQLHDLGKVAMADSVLHKPGRLSAAELEEIRTHPEIGASIVERVPALRDLATVVRHHHERFDGGGYGYGLAGEEIPLEARILAVVDSFDAMTTARPYRSAMSVSDAIHEMNACSGAQFDPVVVGHLIKILQTKGEMEQR